MRLSSEERAHLRAAFRTMSIPQKLDYIVTYFKLPLVIACIGLVAVGTLVVRAVTHKDALLYVAFANVVPPEEVELGLDAGFVESMGADPRGTEVVCYRELYLSGEANTANHEYAYASRLKLMAAIEGHQLDVVLMNQEAYDLLSASGYLMDLGEAFASDPRLSTNVVVLEDNQVEVDLGEAASYEAQTREVANGLEVTTSALLAGFSGAEPLYLGVISNTARADVALAYLAYVAG